MVPPFNNAGFGSMSQDPHEYGDARERRAWRKVQAEKAKDRRARWRRGEDPVEEPEDEGDGGWNFDEAFGKGNPFIHPLYGTDPHFGDDFLLGIKRPMTDAEVNTIPAGVKKYFPKQGKTYMLPVSWGDTGAASPGGP